MPATLILNTGFEHGVLSTNGGGLFMGITGPPTLDGTIKRSGSYSLRCGGTAVQYVQVIGSIGQPYLIGRFYWYAGAAHGSNNLIMRLCTGGTAYASYLIYANPNGTFSAGCYTGDIQTGGSWTSGTWYMIEFRAYCGSTAGYLDWRIDGTAMTQATCTLPQAHNFDYFQLGDGWTALGANVYDYFDDLALSVTSNDYPLGAGQGVGLSPTGDGTHSDPSDRMQDNDGNHVRDISDVHDHLNSVPISDNTTYIKQTANGTGDYAEVTFSGMPAGTVNGARAILAYMSATATTNNGKTYIYTEDGDYDTVYSGDMSESSMFYKSVQVHNPTGGWDQAAVNALKGRVGYSSDTNPNPYWENLIIEVDYTPEAASPQTLTPGGIASAEGFGTTKANFLVNGLTGIASAEAFGTDKLNFILKGAGIDSLEAFGGHTFRLYLQPSGIASLEAVSNPKVNLWLAPSAIASLESFGAGKLNFIILPAGLGSAEAFGAHTVKLMTGPQTLIAEGIASLEGFGGAKFIVYLVPPGIGSAESFGTDKLNFILKPSGVLTAEGFGTSKLNFRLAPSGITTAELFGSHVISLSGGLQYITPGSIASLEAFGTSKLNLRLYASAIASSEAFGTGRMMLYLRPSGVGSLEAFGSAKINFRLLAQAIASAEAFGTTTLYWDQFLEPAGIATGEAFGAVGIVFIVGASAPIVFDVVWRELTQWATPRELTQDAAPRDLIQDARIRTH